MECCWLASWIWNEKFIKVDGIEWDSSSLTARTEVPQTKSRNFRVNEFQVVTLTRFASISSVFKAAHSRLDLILSSEFKIDEWPSVVLFGYQNECFWATCSHKIQSNRYWEDYSHRRVRHQCAVIRKLSSHFSEIIRLFAELYDSMESMI